MKAYIVALRKMNAGYEEDANKVKAMFLDRKDADGYLNMLIYFNEDSEFTHPFLYEKEVQVDLNAE